MRHHTGTKIYVRFGREWLLVPRDMNGPTEFPPDDREVFEKMKTLARQGFMKIRLCRLFSDGTEEDIVFDIEGL